MVFEYADPEIGYFEDQMFVVLEYEDIESLDITMDCFERM